MKREKYKKNLTTTIKLFTFFFFFFSIGKRTYFSRKHSLEKFSLYYYISSKAVFSAAGNLKRSNETPTSI